MSYSANLGQVSPKLHMLRQKMFVLRHRFMDDFVFIHINKTGGSSIERALRIPFQHKTARETIESMGRKEWDRRYSFAVVRNPWDKVVSHYLYRVQTNQTALKEHPIPFGEWVRLAYVERDPFYCDNAKMFMPQHEWIIDDRGDVAVKNICRFESLNDDIEQVCKDIGQECHLPRMKATKRDHYSIYYDDNTRNIVAEFFREDIDRFDYSFEDSKS